MIFSRFHRLPLKRKLVPVVLVFSCICIVSILLNLLVINIQSTVRAFVVAEGLWSKSEHDATLQLQLYGRTRDPVYFANFQQAMAGPLAYRDAHLELLKHDYDPAKVRAGLIVGGTDVDDIAGLIRLFRCCSRWGAFHRANVAWFKGDQFLSRLQDLARALHTEITQPSPSPQNIAALLQEVDSASKWVRPYADEFTRAFSEGERALLQWLRFLTIAVVSLLILSGLYMTLRILRGVRQSEEQYRVLFNTANDAVFVFERSTGKILEANHGAEGLARTSVEVLLSKRYQDYFPEVGTPGAGVDYLLGNHQATMRVDGLAIPVEIGGSMTHLGKSVVYLAIVRDISQRIKSDAALRVAANAIANMAEGLVIADADHRVISVNPAFTAITGFSVQEVMQQPLHFLMFRYRDATFYNAIIDLVVRTGKWQGELYHQRKNGEVFPAQISISAVFDENNKVLQFVKVFNDISKNKEYEIRLQHLSLYDTLTQLPNRATFHERAQKIVEKAATDNSKLALLYIDLDGFKMVNETYGHAAGDYLLQAVASRLQKCLSAQALIGRLGGDEFAALLANIVDEQEVQQLAGRLLQVMAENISFSGQELSIFASIGVSFFPRDAGSLQALLTNADTAMHEAKRRGRNNVQVFNPDMTINMASRLQMSRFLRQAIENHEFELYYQPCIAMKSTHMASVEALLRWHQPELGDIAPDIFIPIAEEVGLISSITEWVLNAACRQGMRWIAEGLEPIQIAVNISPASFWDTQLPGNIGRILAQTGYPAARLCLEITETALRNQERSKQMLYELNAMGMQLAIDDFGVGYSSLNYLKHFPVNYLKIDRSFVARIVQDQNDAAIARAIIALAKSLDLAVIAEGVETAEQGAFLRAEGCDEAQGYFYGRPMPAAKLATLMRHEVVLNDA